jgi:hypothetical protein
LVEELPGVDEEELEEEEEEDDEFAAPEPVDEDGVRLIREVEFRKAWDPPPTFWPLVEVIEGAVEAADVDESPEDIPPPPPLIPLPPPLTEVPVPRDCRAPPPPPPPPPLRRLPSRPPPLRLPRNCGLIRDEKRSAPVVPVRRTVR